MFSIIVPVYNVEEYLRDCIESIIEQSFEDYELILIDDGSSDGSGIICDEYAKNDSRISVIHQTNRGLSAARNVGMKVADGEYFLFVDSDDALEYNNALKDIEVILREKKFPDILMTKTWSGEDKTNTSGEDMLEFFLHIGLTGGKVNTAVWDKVYRQDFIKNHELYFKDGYVHEDALWSCVVLYNAKRCELTNCNFYRHVVVNTSITRTTDEKAVLNRVISKFNISYEGVQYFKSKDIKKDTRQLVYEYFIGVYINGIVQGMQLKNELSKNTMMTEMKKTETIFCVGIYTKNIKYKLLGFIYKVCGIDGIRNVLRLRYK